MPEGDLWDWSSEYGTDRDGARRKAWITHLIAKGCHPKTAERKACDRVRSGKWPKT